MIGDLKHYAQRSKLDPRQLREVAEAHLIKLLHALTEGAQSQISPLNVGEAAQMAIDRHTSALGSALTYKLREFDIGMSQGGSGLSQSNTINAHTIIGGVQQGSHGSSQHINQSVMLEGLAEAASALEAALTECPRSSVVDDLRVDVATVQSQLAKTEPSQGILSEAGKSIRSIAEGVTAGALTSPAVAAAITLASMLGAA